MSIDILEATVQKFYKFKVVKKSHGAGYEQCYAT